MENKSIKQKIEGLLFISGEPMSVKKLAKILSIKEINIEKVIEELKKEYLERQSGLAIIESNKIYQITTSAEISDVIEKLIKTEMKEELSPASLETLAIIAYKGPLTRLEIDNIRGVNSSFILRSLSIRALIDKEKDSKRTNAYVYSASLDLLKKLGLGDINQLPEYEVFKKKGHNILELQ